MLRLPGLLFFILQTLASSPAASGAVHFSTFATLPAAVWNLPQSATSPLVKDAEGNYYGTGRGGPEGNPLVYKLSTSGELTILHQFASGTAWSLTPDGSGGFLGIFSAAPAGDDYVFRIATDGTCSVKATFDSSQGWVYPAGNLVHAGDGFYYGVTLSKSYAQSPSAFFRMSESGEITLLSHFSGEYGNGPVPGLVEGPDGALYGITYGGNDGSGPRIFRASRQGEISIVHQVETDESHSWLPVDIGPLAVGPDGALYGALSGSNPSGTGGGLFRVGIDGSGWAIHTLDAGTNVLVPALGADGQLHSMVEGLEGATTLPASLIRIDTDLTLTQEATYQDRVVESLQTLTPQLDGTFVGTASLGGTRSMGGVIQLNATGGFDMLAEFQKTESTTQPGKLAFAADGTAYGTRLYGGTNGRGEVFRLTPEGVYSTVGKLADSTPVQVIVGQDGNLYGISVPVRTTDRSTLFKMTPQGEATTLGVFTSGPPVRLFQAPGGELYGFTSGTNDGTLLSQVFRATPAGDFEILKTFNPNGQGSVQSLVYRGNDGYLWGSCSGFPGDPILFRMKAQTALDGGYTGYYTFSGDVDEAQLIAASNGGLYGFARRSGGSVPSYLFQFRPEVEPTPAGATRVTHLHDLAADEGSIVTDLTEGSDGRLYGQAIGYPISEIFSLAGTGGDFRVLRFFDPFSLGVQPQMLASGPDGGLFGYLIPWLGNPAYNQEKVFRLHLDDAPTRFDAWLQAQALSDPDGDDDHDGLSNRMEFALGTDPHDPSLSGASYDEGSISSGVLAVSRPWGAGGADVITYSRSKAADEDGVIVIPEVSIDLSTWLPVWTSTPEAPAVGDGNVEILTRQYPYSVGFPSSYYRLRVVTP